MNHQSGKDEPSIGKVWAINLERMIHQSGNESHQSGKDEPSIGKG